MIAGRGVHLPRDSPISPPTRMPLSQMFLKPWGGSAPISHAYFTFAPGSSTGLVEVLTAGHCLPLAHTASEDLYPSPTGKTTLRPGLLLDPQKTVTGRQVSGRHCPNEEMETQKPPGLIQHRVQRARGGGLQSSGKREGHRLWRTRIRVPLPTQPLTQSHMHACVCVSSEKRSHRLL